MKLNMIQSSVLVLARTTAGLRQASDVASSDASAVMNEGSSGGKGKGRGRP
jgi:hypothetical protein